MVPALVLPLQSNTTGHERPCHHDQQPQTRQTRHQALLPSAGSQTADRRPGTADLAARNQTDKAPSSILAGARRLVWGEEEVREKQSPTPLALSLSVPAR